MSYTISCPSCSRLLNVTEKAFGKTVPCPSCSKPLVVPTAAEMSSPSSQHTENHPAHVTPPAGMPPVPESPAPLVGGNELAHRDPSPPELILHDTAGRHGVEPGGAPDKSRSFADVWIVFFAVLQGLALLVYGLVIAVGANMLSAMGGMAEGFSHRSEMMDMQRLGAIGGLILEGLGVTFLLVGMLTLVACYGFWTARDWGRQLMRGLAIAYTAIGALSLLVALVTRAGILTSLAGLVIWLLILVYLFGRWSETSGQLRGYYDRLRRPA